MSTFTALLGETLAKDTKGATVATADALKDKVVGLYFSAHWCPPCRGFTPVLAESYKKITASGKNLEIVFVSSDKDEASFHEYFGEMPWLSLPFADRERKEKLSKKFKVQGIPTFVILNSDGSTITTDGRSAIAEDPEGKDFPWVPPAFSKVFGDSFVRNDGSKVTAQELETKTLAIYFSAHWCPPCRAFTPKLIETYNTMKKNRGDDFEFIFASSDKSDAEFKDYFKDMPWLAIPFEDRTRKNALSKVFGVEGIPTLVTVGPGPNREVISKDARSGCSADPTGAEFPWVPKPFNDLSTTADGINENPSLVVMLAGCADAAVAEAVETVKTLAEAHFAEAKAKGEEPSMSFFTAKKDEGVVGRIRQLVKVPAGAKIVMLDIPDKGGYYVAEGEDVSSKAIKDFVAAYHAGTLSRQQLE